MQEGMFLGYKVNTDGLKVCPEKADAVLSLPSLRCLKDVQKLNGKLASLNRFLSKSAEKSLPFFKTLKKCTKRVTSHWISRMAEAAFKQMKKLIAELPMLTAPKEKEELIVYLAATKEAISAVLMTDREGKQVPVYFVSRALRGPEINYTPMEKLVLALLSASKRLKRYFQAHTIVMDMIYNIGPKGLQFKGQILADFIVERPEEESPDELMTEPEELPEPWTLFTDGSSCVDGSGAGLILTNAEGAEFTYAMRHDPIFEQSKNARKKLQGIFHQASTTERKQESRCPKQRLRSTSFSHLSNQVEEEGNTWMTPICEYLTKEILPADKKKARAVRRKAARFGLPGEIVSDNGKQFRDNPFKDWCEKLCIRQCFASVKHPQTNGLLKELKEFGGEGE
ncbi:reverse transcriptase domain-containing protein [Tanacetum coccineum]